MFEICKIVSIPALIEYNFIERIFLNVMPDLIGTEWSEALDYTQWERGDGKRITALKKSIKTKLEAIQGLNCAFCGMTLKVTSEEQIEHVAPKGRNRYPEYMFYPNNLVLACGLCNGFEKKERREFRNIIGKRRDFYELHYFNIVHPKLDNPRDHYDLGRDEDKITITNLSLKGQKSIAMLELDQEPHTTERGKMLMRHLYEISPTFRDLYNQIAEENGL
jgi:uncharacterized protein (TIGR02646 family)